MNKELKLTLDLPQSINHLYGRNKFGSVYMKAEGKKYKEKMIAYIQEQAKIQGWDKLDNKTYCYLNEVIYMNKKGRDADNLKKLLQDVITESGLIWGDDSLCLPQTKRIYIDKNNPRVEITLSNAPFVGVFNNENEANNFINNCKDCKRYSRNCSLLNDVLDNKIIPEIAYMDAKNTWFCSKYKK